MKITREVLKQIILEELDQVISEFNLTERRGHGYYRAPDRKTLSGKITYIPEPGEATPEQIRKIKRIEERLTGLTKGPPEGSFMLLYKAMMKTGMAYTQCAPENTEPYGVGRSEELFGTDVGPFSPRCFDHHIKTLEELAKKGIGQKYDRIFKKILTGRGSSKEQQATYDYFKSGGQMQKDFGLKPHGEPHGGPN